MYNLIDGVEVPQPKTETEFFVKFNRPEALPNPIRKFYDTLYNLKDKIGVEKVQQELETFAYGWGLESGYSLEINRDKKLYTFTHVSMLD